MVKVYFDYLCPFAWRGLELAYVLSQHHGLEFELLHYSLEQGNHIDNAANRSEPLWRLSNHPENVRSLPQFVASQAAKLQGKELHFKFILELFRLRHHEKAEFGPASFNLAAQRAELDLERFHTDLSNADSRRTELALELETADNLGVFGTPTFQLESGDAAYFRFAQLTTDPRSALELWTLYTGVLESPYGVETVKRPRKAVKSGG